MAKEQAAIVRELAEDDPYLADGVCLDCDVDFISRPSLYSSNPDHHAPACLWRRARALYPKGAE